MSRFDLDIHELFGLNSIDEIFEARMEGMEIMTKTKYEDSLRQLEEEEGKLLTIPEISDMLKVPQETIRVKLDWNNAKTFKLRHYRTKQNVTLVPMDEVLRLVAQNTSVLPVLKALAKSDVVTDATTVKTLIRVLESYRG